MIVTIGCSTGERYLSTALAEEARAQQLKIVNCGPCGRCSTVHDLGRFRAHSSTIAKVVGPCIVAYLFGGAELDRMCMTSRAQFTLGCTDCWVEDHMYQLGCSSRNGRLQRKDYL